MRTQGHRLPVAAVTLLALVGLNETGRGSGAAGGQVLVRFASPAQAPASFEVASIKRNLTWTQPGSGLAAPQPGGRYRGVGVTLRRLVSDAYGMPGERVFGGPDWIGTMRFDIEARTSGEPTGRQILQMLRPLLVERFRLAVHSEMREMPSYVLRLVRAGRLGPQLHASDGPCAEAAANYFPSTTPGGDGPPCGDFRMGAGSLTARGMTMSGLAERLAGLAGRPVIDRTDLQGAFDLQLAWSPDTPGAAGPRAPGDAPPQDNSAPTIFTAVKEQLALELVPERASVPVLVIDRAELPSPD